MERLTEEEVHRLISCCRQGDREAENLMVERFGSLVKSVARGFFGSLSEREDLEQVGYLGLIKAVHRFDPSRGARFSTFAVAWIKGEILNYLRGNKELLPLYSRYSASLSSHLNPGGKVAADNTGAAVGSENTPGHNSYAYSGGRMENTTLFPGASREEAAAAAEYALILPWGEKIEDASSGEMVDDRAVQRVWLKEALKELKSVERKVIFYRYFKEKSQEEVGRILDISQRQVSRLEKRVLSKMKESMRS